MRVLTVPGYTGSGPEHWQSLWERSRPEFRRVEQRDWDEPRRAEWVATLDAAIRSDSTPVYLVAHSLGCITVAHWAHEHPSLQVQAALLVAPADVEKEGFRAVVEDFCPIPLQPLPFPSVLVASSDDPYLPPFRARALAHAWRSELVEVGAKGHVNTAAGFGPWPEGERLLAELIRRSAQSRRTE